METRTEVHSGVSSADHERGSLEAIHASIIHRLAVIESCAEVVGFDER